MSESAQGKSSGSPPPKRPRVTSLDGLRGLAASSVLMTHAIGAMAKAPEQTVALFQSPISVFANGSGGVNLFFVLSGYCLSESAGRATNRLGLAQYYARRVLRIHLPFVAALIVTGLASHYLYPAGEATAGMSRLALNMRNVSLSAEDFGRALLFPGTASGLIPVGWTLTIEMIYSLLLPFMIWLVVRSHWGVLVLISMAVLFLDWKTLPVKHYAIDFSLGIAIYYERERLAAFFGRIRGWRSVGLLLGGWVVMAIPILLLFAGRYQRVSILLYATGSAILVAGAIHDPRFRSFLSRKLIAWSGRISYSVYLIHIPVILLLAGLVRERVNMLGGAVFVAACLIVTHLVAAGLYRIAEKPSMDLGYVASAKLASLAARRSEG